jgi:ABC-type lipoprotein release transport system permease subunit
MRALITPQIAFRNFTRNSRRFILLGLAVTAGFFFVCTVQSLVAGLSYQINTRGARFYGGHVIISRVPGFLADMTITREDRFVLDAIDRVRARPAAISHRTHFGADGVVFFNGESVRIRRVIGMDWSTEGGKISGLQFVSGKPAEMNDPRGALISEVTSRRMGARVGDLITLQVNREGGAINTVPLLIKAIFREVSIFGYYTVYMDRRVLSWTRPLAWTRSTAPRWACTSTITVALAESQRAS